MSQELHDQYSQWDDMTLLDHLVNQADQFTPEALDAMHQALRQHGVSDEQIAAFRKGEELNAASHRSLADDTTPFMALEAHFHRNDLFIAHALLSENRIPFSIDTTFREGQETVFTISVPQPRLADAQTLFAGQFQIREGLYEIHYSSGRERLKAFTFNESVLSLHEHGDTFALSLDERERSIIVTLAKRLLDEADTIEAQQDRILFFYDQLEELIDRVKRNQTSDVSMNDLFAMLEVLQVYCDDPQFDDTALELATTLLGLITSPT